MVDRERAGSYACIFDVDGVLVDSCDAHLQSWIELARETGHRLDRAEFSASFGRTSRDIIRAHWPGPPDEAAVAAMDDRKEAIYRDLIVENFPAMDGAIELIGALHDEGFRIALGSSGPPENIDLVIDRLGCGRLLDAVITGRDVMRGKPDPQVFLLAAERLAVPPARCCVIEDAPAGIHAANAAGMTAIALISTGRTEAELAAAHPDHITASLRDLTPELMRTWMEG